MLLLLSSASVCTRVWMARVLGLHEGRRTHGSVPALCPLPSAVSEILGKALDAGGRTNGVFVSLLFLKILHWRVFQIIEEIVISF